MYTVEFLEILKQSEELLQFKTFDQEDAYRLGTILRQIGMAGEQPVAVRIVLDDLTVYQSFPNGTTAENGWWMDRKYATVLKSRTSSLRALVERELYGVREDWQEDEVTHAFCGGGFPLVVDGVFRGVAIVSGLPHLEDHALLTRGMGAYLGCTAPELPAVEESL